MYVIFLNIFYFHLSNQQIFFKICNLNLNELQMIL